MGCPAGLEPRRPNGVGFVVFTVLVDDRTVTRVLQIDRLRSRALHGNRFPDDLHRLPMTLIAILQRIGRIGVVDVQVLHIAAEVGESPGAVGVVSDRYPRDGRLAAADDVPSRSDEVYPVAQ